MKYKVWLLLFVMCTLVLLLSVDGSSIVSAATEYTLSISIENPAGGTTTPSLGDHSIPGGDTVTVTASANIGWKFIGWDGPDAVDCRSGSVTMDKNKSCTAVFGAYLLMINVDPPQGGSVTLDPDNVQYPAGYPAGMAVILKPDAASQHSFAGWAGPDKDACSKLPFTMPAQDLNCTAVFSPDILPPGDYHRWMTAIANHIEDRRLMDVVLPGSHDAGTYAFDQDAVYTDPDPNWEIVGDIAPLIGMIKKDITASWAKTQSGSITWQLYAGMRYFDLRFFQEDDGLLYIHHGQLRGDNDSDDIFGQIDDFLDGAGHEKEIIILDFTTWSGLDDAHYRDFVDDFLELFEDKMIPAEYSHATLGEIWALDGKPQLVVRFEGLKKEWFTDGNTTYEYTDPEDYDLFWPQKDPLMCRPWANAQEEDALRIYTVHEMECPCCTEPERDDEQLFMLQGIFTPDKPTIECGLRHMVDQWLDDFKWVCKIPIAGPITCGAVNEGLKLLGCEDEADWKNAPINLYQMAIGPTDPGNGTPDTLGRVKSWWQSCQNNTRDNLNIIAVDFVEASNFGVVEESRLINMGEYNNEPKIIVLDDLKEDEGKIVNLVAYYEDDDKCDHHTASIHWGDLPTIEEAVVNRAAEEVQGTITSSHVYADNNDYTVTVCVQDGPTHLPSIPFINEIHYDNSGSDTDERIEIAGEAGSDLTGWSLQLYRGLGGTVYDTVAIDLTIPDLDNGYGTVAVLTPGIRDGKDGGVDGSNLYGEPDGIALVDDSDNVIQFLCYEGDFKATDGPAVGLTCTDIGVSETGSELPGLSLQLSGVGARYKDFHHYWKPPAAETFGEINAGQTFSAYMYHYSETCDTFQAKIENVAPTVYAGEDKTIGESDTFTLEPARFNDLGTLDTHKETTFINWGDGTTHDSSTEQLGDVSESPFGPPGSTLGANGTVAGSFLYGDNSTYTVEVCVTDDDGGTGCDELLVTVNNINPTVDFDKSTGISFNGGLAFLARRGVEQTFNSDAADIGTDDLTFTWAFPPSGHGSLSTYFNDGTNPDPPHDLDPAHSPHGNRPFERSDMNNTTFTKPGVYEATIDIYDDDSGHVMDSLPVLVTDSRGCTAASSTWGHEYGVGGKQTIDDLRLQGYLDLIRFASAYFDDGNLADLADAKAIFSANGRKDANHLKQHTLAAWLNFASGGVLWDRQIRHLDGPFHETIGEIDAVLLNPNASKKEIVDAQKKAIRINTSRPSNSVCNDAGTP